MDTSTGSILETNSAKLEPSRSLNILFHSILALMTQHQSTNMDSKAGSSVDSAEKSSQHQSTNIDTNAGSSIDSIFEFDFEKSSQHQSINIDTNAGSIILYGDEIFEYLKSLIQDKSTSTTDLPTADGDSLCNEIPHPSQSINEIPHPSQSIDKILPPSQSIKYLGHPLFTQVFGTRRKRNVGTSTTEDRMQLYFCVECDMFVHKTMPDITNHFITREHVPQLPCVYCQGAVFTYLDNRTVQYHHKCDNISPSN